MVPFFSVVIPTFNRVHLIEPTINSILAQSFENFEILIIDDGSTDGTADFIQRKYLHDHRIQYFYKKNEERGAARNYGFGKSRGEFVVFLDSDDILRKSHLATLYEAILRKPQIRFIASKYEISRNGHCYPSDLDSLDEGFYGIEVVLDGNPFACNFSVRRDNPNLKLFRQEREFVVVEDWVFLVENLISDSMYLVDERTVVMTDHDQRSMRSHHRDIIRARLFALNWLLSKYTFANSQIKRIAGHSYYFCAIHNYIDGRSIDGLQLLLKAIGVLGLEMRTIILGLKLIIGRKMIERVLRPI